MDVFTISNERLGQKNGLIKKTAWLANWLLSSLVAHALRWGNGCDDVTH
jgi:hypothetical protein